MGSSVLDFIAHGGPASPEFQTGLQRVSQNMPAVEAAQAQAQTRNIDAEAQQRQMQTQQLQQQLKDAEAIRQAYIQNAASHDQDKLENMIRQNASGSGYLAWKNQDLAMRSSAVKLGKEQADFETEMDAKSGEQLNAIRSSDEAQKGALYQAALPDLQRWSPNVKWPVQYPGDSTIDFFQGALNHGAAILSQNKTKADIAQSTQATKTSQANQNVLQAELPGKIAESDVKVAESDALKNFAKDPGAIDKQISDLFPNNPKRAREYQSSFRSAFALKGREGAAAELAKATEEAGAPAKAAAVEAATAPGRLRERVAEAQATAPIETAKAIATAKALREADNPALEHVPPGLAQATVADAIKLDGAAAQAKQAADDIGTILDMADAGNKAANANVPLVGVGALNAVNGIKRINSAEIHQYGTAGSLFDKIQGKLQGWTEGKPIPTDVIDDMRQLHEALSKEAYQKYTTELNSLNKRTGAQFEPTIEAPKARAKTTQIPAGAKVQESNLGRKRYSTDGGKTWVVVQ